MDKNLFEYVKKYLEKNPDAKEIFELFKISEKEYLECLKYISFERTFVSVESMSSNKGEFNVDISTVNK
jgi:DNA-directed RNA polymerase specialized sigma subunit